MIDRVRRFFGIPPRELRDEYKAAVRGRSFRGRRKIRRLVYSGRPIDPPDRDAVRASLRMFLDVEPRARFLSIGLIVLSLVEAVVRYVTTNSLESAIVQVFLASYFVGVLIFLFWGRRQSHKTAAANGWSL